MRLEAGVSPAWIIRNVEVWEGDQRLRYVVAVDTDEGWVEQRVVRCVDPEGSPIFARDERGKPVVAKRHGTFRLVDPTTGGEVGP